MSHLELPEPTPRLIRILRWTRMLVHVWLAFLLVAAIFPRVSSHRRGVLLQWWSARLLRVLNIRLKVSGQALAENAANTLLAANHVSWVDIFVINAAHPSRFVAKSEIRTWPLVGWLCEASGTLFVERGRRRDAARVAAVMHAALQEGDTIGLFPEGTTTAGDRLLKFNSSLFEPAIANHVELAPAAIRYRNSDGERCEAIAFIGDLSFADSLKMIIAQREISVELTFGSHIATAGLTRRELAAQAEAAVATLLNVPPPEVRQRFDGVAPIPA